MPLPGTRAANPLAGLRPDRVWSEFQGSALNIRQVIGQAGRVPEEVSHRDGPPRRIGEPGQVPPYRIIGPETTTLLKEQHRRAGEDFAHAGEVERRPPCNRQPGRDIRKSMALPVTITTVRSDTERRAGAIFLKIVIQQHGSLGATVSAR
jgi:hypothetical protein